MKKFEIWFSRSWAMLIILLGPAVIYESHREEAWSIMLLSSIMVITALYILNKWRKGGE